MFLASCAATAGHSEEWIGSSPCGGVGGGLVAPVGPVSAADETEVASRASTNSAFISRRLCLKQPERQSATRPERRVDGRDARMRPRIRESQLHRAGFLE